MTFDEPVLHVIAPSPAGGAESVVASLAGSFAKHAKVAVIEQGIAPGEPVHPLSDELRARGVEVFEIRCGRRKYGREARVLADLLRAMPSVLVHTHGYHATFVSALATRKHAVPLVATVHGYIGRDLKERLYNFLDRHLLRRFDAVIAVSEPIEQLLLKSGLRRQQTYLVPNGIAPNRHQLSQSEALEQLGIPASERVIGWIGRLSREKGPDLFLRALAMMPAGTTGVIVGDGPELARLQLLWRDLGVPATGPAVHFAGRQRDAARLLPAFEVFALSSRSEGTPMVILEAAAAATPIVSFAVGGVPAVLGKESALLVPAGDIPEFAAALASALNDTAESQRRAAVAREIVERNFGAEVWYERVRAVHRHARAQFELRSRAE